MSLLLQRDVAKLRSCFESEILLHVDSRSPVPRCVVVWLCYCILPRRAGRTRFELRARLDRKTPTKRSEKSAGYQPRWKEKKKHHRSMGKTGKRSRAGKEEPAGRKPGEPLSRPLVDMRGVASRLRASSRMGEKKTQYASMDGSESIL